MVVQDTLEMDIDATPYRTRSTTKRARSPSSPTQYDRPSKRFSSGHDTSMPLPLAHFHPAAARLRPSPDDWVSQTQGLRLEGSLEPESRATTPGVVQGGVRIDEVMLDVPMSEYDSMIPIPPTQPSLTPPLQIPQSQYLRAPGGPVLCLPSGPVHPHNPNQLQIPAIHFQAATPSPVQLVPPANSTSDGAQPFASQAVHSLGVPSPSTSIASDEPHEPYPATGQPKKQRFTMGPRADCELCRMHVKGHYMHFD